MLLNLNQGIIAKSNQRIDFCNKKGEEIFHLIKSSIQFKEDSNLNDEEKAKE